MAVKRLGSRGRRQALIKACVIVIAALAGCAPAPDIVIGFAGSLSGPNYQLGVEGRNAALLFVERINARGGIDGRRLRLIVKDMGSKPGQIVALDKELLDEGAAVIFGHFTSAFAEAALPFMNEARIVLVSPTATSESLSGRDDFLFRTIMSSKKDPVILAGRIKATGAGSILLIATRSNPSYVETYLPYLRGAFAVAGEIDYDSPEGIDYASIARMPAFGAVVIVASAIDTGSIAQALRSRGIGQRIYASGWAKAPELLQYGGSAVEGIELVHQIDDSSPAALAFAEDYRKAFGSPPGFAAMESYDALLLIGAALEAGGRDRESFYTAIKGIHSVEALSGTIPIDAFGDADRPLRAFRVEDGAIRALGPGE